MEHRKLNAWDDSFQRKGKLDLRLICATEPSGRCDLAAARRFFRGAITTHGVPDRVVIDKSGANLAGLQAVNVIPKFTGAGKTIDILQVKYLNNILEHPSRGLKVNSCPLPVRACVHAREGGNGSPLIKRITAPMMRFKAFHCAQATIAGIETAHMIRKGQNPINGRTAFQQFADLAA